MNAAQAARKAKGTRREAYRKTGGKQAGGEEKEMINDE
jgi:hypothetical protein